MITGFGIELLQYFNLALLWFVVFVMASYLVLAVISIFAMRNHLHTDGFDDYSVLLSSDLAPSVSIIAPAYNEGKTIRENVRSLLSLNYNSYEVIIVNDGSKDDSMDVLMEAYHLVRVDLPATGNLKTKKIKGIYRSLNPALKKLLVVDKENGGKSDALNTGINFSTSRYIACIDVDCIIEKDALLKMVKPFMVESGHRVIATGGVVRIANSCIIKEGRLIEVKLPEEFLPRVQVLEYIRAFLLGRMAWTKMDGLLLISGAFGMFDREIVLLAGGYSTSTVGEDMELVVRMRRYMIEKKVPYKVRYIPDPLCWTEAPNTFDVLGKQRNRWTRGTMETLWTHRGMCFNPKYRFLGLVSYPYWLIFEYMAPILEVIGLVITLVLGTMGLINWSHFFTLIAFVYSFVIMFSMLALLSDEFTYRQYKKRSDVLRLIGVAFIEPFVFHPFAVYSAIQGNIHKIRGKGGWGNMVRAGFVSK